MIAQTIDGVINISLSRDSIEWKVGKNTPDESNVEFTKVRKLLKAMITNVLKGLCHIVEEDSKIGLLSGAQTIK